MKPLLKSIIGFFLKWCAKTVIWRYKPFIIAIAGSEGKSEAREKISNALKKRGDVHVRENSRGYNTVFSLPLSILDEPTGKSDPKLWWKIIVSSFRKAILGMPFPEVLMLEFGVDTKGEMEKLLKIVRPDIGILLCIRPRGFGDEGYCETLQKEFQVFAHASYRFLANFDDDLIFSAVKDMVKRNGKTFSIRKSDVSFSLQRAESEVFLFASETGERKILPKECPDNECSRSLIAFSTECLFHSIYQTLKSHKNRH